MLSYRMISHFQSAPIPSRSLTLMEHFLDTVVEYVESHLALLINLLHDQGIIKQTTCMSRFFTAVAIYQLQEKGLLNVTDAVRARDALLLCCSWVWLFLDTRFVLPSGEQLYRACRLWHGTAVVPQDP